MSFILKQIVVPVVSAVMGGLIVLGAVKFLPAAQTNIQDSSYVNRISDDVHDDIFNMQNGIKRHFDRILNDDIFRPIDPLTDRFGLGIVNSISKREDEDSIYYDIKVEDVNSTSIDAKIENGYLTITGTTERKNGLTDEEDGHDVLSQSIYKSTFNRKFPLPDHIDQSKMQMLPEKDKIVLKFPKLKAS